ncbi:MAG: hypothetical protein JWO32_2230, partial [Bacteroidetes bacterium]|nr:hypothetical protein [Bacteroidota bacterium]
MRNTVLNITRIFVSPTSNYNLILKNYMKETLLKGILIAGLTLT